jgi:ketosteroid isomerase-like protein
MTHNADLIRNTYDAFARGDIATVLALLDPKVEWTEAAGFPYAGTYRGPEAVLAEVLIRLGTEWDDFEAVPDRIAADDGIVIATGTYSGTFKATGRSFAARFAHAWEMRDGKVVRFEQIADTAKVQEALA